MFEQLGLGLYRPWLLETFVQENSHLGAFTSFPARSKEMEVGKCQQFLWVTWLVIEELGIHRCLNTKRNLNGSEVGYQCELHCFGTAEKGEKSPAQGTSRKMG